MIYDRIKGALWGLLLCCAVTLLCGCRTKYVAVPEVHYRDSVRTVHQRDSVYQRDSVFVTQYAIGDTVYRVRELWRVRYRDRLRRDTVLAARRDSVAVPVPVTAAQRRDWRGALALGLIIAAVTLLAERLLRREG